MAQDRTAQIAEFVVGTSYEAIPAEVATAAVRPIIDTLAVYTAGLTSEAGLAALRFAEANSGKAAEGTIVGSPLRVPPELAALVNGTLGHSLDFDDEMSLGGGHPSSLVLGAILAMPAGQALSGTAVIEAYVAGHEVAAWVAKALGRPHYRKGWHITLTAGTMGATAAAAKLLGLDIDQIRTALGIAGSMASGLQRNIGTMTKPLHSGLAARNGVLAAQLAKSRLSAAPNIFDGPKGYLDIFGVGSEIPQELDALGVRYALVDPGSSLKKYPCCYATHRAIDAVLETQDNYGFSVAEVSKASCTVPIGGLRPLVYSTPTTGLEGKFSLQYTIAAAFIDRRVTLDSFTNAAVRRAEIQELLPRIEIADDPRCRPEDPENENGGVGSGGFVELKVSGRGLETLTEVRFPSGSPVKPLSWQDIDDKFRDCLRAGDRNPNLAAELIPRLRGLAEVEDIHQLLQPLARPA